MNEIPAYNFEDLEKLCKKLKVPGISSGVKEFTKDPDNLDKAPQEWLMYALRYEEAQREERSLQRRLKASQLRHKDALISKIDFNPVRGLNRKTLTAMSTCDWIRATQNCLIVGKAGVGKTWIASALGHAACCSHMNVRMVRMPLLLDEIRATKLTGIGIGKFIGSFQKFHLLILDDWGLGKLDSYTREVLVELIEARNGVASTMVTTVLPIKSWSAYIADNTVSDALMDRFLEKVIKIEVKGPSMRTGVE